MTGHFDPTTGRLTMELPLPPSKNALHYSGRYAYYPKPAYKDWLANAAPFLRRLLGSWEPDAESWWRVEGELWLDTGGDGPNYQEALLDLLSGTHWAEKDAHGKRQERLLKGPGLWNDDRRVHVGSWRVMAVRCPKGDGKLRVVVRKATPPTDIRAEREAVGRRQKAAAREQKRQERERQRQDREAERQRQREAKKREREARRSLARDAILLATRGGDLLRYQIPAPVRTRILRAAECGPAAYKAALNELRAERGVTAPTRCDEAWREQE